MIEACVESRLLYDCQVRVWYKRDVRRLQKWVNKCCRYICSDRNGKALSQLDGGVSWCEECEMED